MRVLGDYLMAIIKYQTYDYGILTIHNSFRRF